MSINTILNKIFFLIILLQAYYCYSNQFLSRDTLRSIADFVIDDTYEEHFCEKLKGSFNPESFVPEKVKFGNIVFVRSNLLKKFFDEFHPKIKNKYVLISHNHDPSAPGNFINYLYDEKIIAWFGQNPDAIHPKFHPIPIGLASKQYPHGNVETINRIRSQLSKIKKNKLLYLNFYIPTCMEERSKVWKMFCHQPFCVATWGGTFERYLQDVAESFFVASPRGGGLDCHRTWETLLAGSVPIVKTSLLDPLFKDLPVLIIKDWSEVTESHLRQKIDDFYSSNKVYNFEKLFISYWLNEIHVCINSVQTQ